MATKLTTPMLGLGRDAVRGAHDRWQQLADDRSLHLHAHELGLSMTGRVNGIEVTIGTDVAYAGLLTRAQATPRIALHGHVRVRQARPVEWLLGPFRTAFLHRSIHKSLVVERSSEAIARTVLDERVGETLRRLLPLFHELRYETKTITLAWQGVEQRSHVLEDVLDCMAYLAVAAASTPYR